MVDDGSRTANEDGNDVRYEVDGRVATVTLDRPRYRNAQSRRLLEELDGAFGFDLDR